ncbi:unannotated protein [freshwater metagenome]|uniref:Unannotated protein n=1 Tax=freshwater metagenome TaxID=449393 RepID=A0A6J7H812_9ZZZZ|nr:DUF2382 domain-containing protein [Actinomycetota bacterium]
MPTIDEVRSWRGRHVVGDDGHKIGTIDELYADDQTGTPAWALVHTGLFGRKSLFLPIADATLDGDDVRVPFDKAFVKDAPGIEPDGHLTAHEEDQLFRYYGRPTTTHDDTHRHADGGVTPAAARTTQSTSENQTGPAGPVQAPGGLPGRARDVDGAMTLSEEQVHVGTRELPATKVRMRKVTVTEDVQMTVPVTREEVRLEEVPIDAPDDPDTLTDGEVTLRHEVPVVQTRTVDSERVRLEKDRVTEQVQVTEPARREEIDVQHTRTDDTPPPA